MSKRMIWSIILVLSAIGAMLIERGVSGGIVGSFFLVVMLFLWVVPGNVYTRDSQQPDPTAKRVSQAILGIGLGLFAAIAGALVLPPQIFSWVIIAVDIILIVWIFLRVLRWVSLVALSGASLAI